MKEGKLLLCLQNKKDYKAITACQQTKQHGWHKLPKLMQEETQTIDRTVKSEETELVIKIFLIKKSLNQMASLVNYTNYLKN